MHALEEGGKRGRNTQKTIVKWVLWRGERGTEEDSCVDREVLAQKGDTTQNSQ